MSRVLAHDIRHVFVFTTGPRLLRSAKSQLKLHVQNRAIAIPSSAIHHDCRVSLSSTSAETPVTPPAWTHQQRRRTIATASSTSSTTTQPEHTTTDTTNSASNAPIPPLAIVFTDIVKSTAIWEKDSPTMSAAMTIHDDLIRALILTHHGYEVKQNGDGFMIAFQSAVPALNFCLDVQMQLQEQAWPEALLEIGPAKPIVGFANANETGAEDGRCEKEGGDAEDEGEKEITVLWKGLRLRMSAHYGEPVCKWNEVIQRMDYLGSAVNRAARFISACEGGQIVVSQEFLYELKRSRRGTIGGDGPLFDDAETLGVNNKDLEELDLKELQGERISEDVSDTRFEVRMLGDRHFKGLSEVQRLFFVVPKSLVGRLAYFPRHKYVQPSKGNLTE